MNKQEALEAILVEVRKLEEPGREVPSLESEYVAEALASAAADFAEALSQMPSKRRTAKLRRLLVNIGACAVYLLRDEVRIVTAEEGAGDGTA